MIARELASSAVVVVLAVASAPRLCSEAQAQGRSSVLDMTKQVGASSGGSRWPQRSRRDADLTLESASASKAG